MSISLIHPLPSRLGLHFTAAAAIITASVTLAAAQSTSPPTRAVSDTSSATQSPAPNGSTTQSTTDPRVLNLARMQKKITVEFKDQRLEDILNFIQQVTQAQFEIEWLEGNATAGLEKDKSITLNAIDLPALTLIERVLTKAQNDTFEENTWQMTDYGALQLGPKSVLNRDKRVVIYDINDMLMPINRYPEAPIIDLGSVLSQGGQGGQSPFTDAGGGNNQRPTEPVKTRDERIREIQDLITSTIEPSQWVDNGGDGATIRSYGNALIVNGPDYVHRNIIGYPYWPSYSASSVNGRRYVSLTPDAAIAKVDQIINTPVTGVVPGAPGGGGGGGGGGRPDGPP